jgi:hypothetical protein
MASVEKKVLSAGTQATGVQSHQCIANSTKQGDFVILTLSLNGL